MGLGEIEVNSFLNQPLKAEIDVVSARPGEIDDLLVSLASRQAFRKAGLERPANLSKLRFTVEKAEDGSSAKILITTKTAVKEPFLNFLIEADWARGRLLREFTVLLDPPFFAQQAAAEQLVAEPTPAMEETTLAESESEPEPMPMPVPIAETAEPIAESDPTEVSERVDIEAAIAAESVAEAETVAEAEPMAEEEPVSEPIALAQEPADSDIFEPEVSDTAYVGDDEIVIEKGDTLWSIASGFQDGEHSMSQIMLALQVTNPEAFGQDNINNLRVGAVLRAPDQETFDILSKQEAYAEVLDQNGLWDEYVARTTGEAMVGTPMATDDEVAITEGEEGGQLSLLAPGEGDTTSASMQQDAGVESGQLRKQLALAEEELEAARLENDDLKSRITALEEQISKFEELQKLVQIEDDSLAQLQQQAAEPSVEEPVVVEETPVEEVVSEEPLLEETAVVEPAEAVIEEAVDSTEEMVTEAAVEPEPELVEEQPVATVDTGDGFIEDAEPAVETETAGLTEEAVEPAAEEALVEEDAPIPAPAPVIVTEAPSTSIDGGIMDMLPSIDQLLGDPILLGGVGGVIIVILLLLFFLMRKKKSPEADEGVTLEEGDDISDDVTPLLVPEEEAAEPDDMPAVAEMEAEDIGVLEEAEDLDELLPDDAEEELAKTAIISAVDMPEPEAPAQAQAAEEQDDVLNEVDVYLAYGLYDNAEELLTESIDNNPGRADYRAKMLDTHFATKNKDSFVREAEALKGLGDAADRYWDRVQIMGFELAPENPLFADAKDSDLSVADLEYAKPEAADFDLGADEEITDFAPADFDLSDDSTFDVADSAEPEAVAELDEEPLLDDELAEPAAESAEDIFDLTEELPDELGDLGDLGESLDDDSLELAGGEETAVDQGDGLEFDLPEELEETRELGAEFTGAEDTSELDMMDEDTTDFKIGDGLDEEMDLGDLDSEVAELESEVADELDLGDLDAGVVEDSATTQLVTPVQPEEGTMHVENALDMDMSDLDDASLEALAAGEEIAADDIELDLGDLGELDTEAVAEDEVAATELINMVEPEEGTVHVESMLDMDMGNLEEADLDTGSFQAADEEPDLDLPEDAIATTEFKPLDMEAAEVELEMEEDVNVDKPVDIVKTGTFAPGDFDEEGKGEAAETAEEDVDIEGLMLPDDVDEVGTKLDLARAFIDMGDAEGAKSSLQEVLEEGDEQQKSEATGLLEQIS
ncbi:MAG: FimV/HubP family polar landmark protein [Gammaproteobacteria bacterium]|nr:FimV/HubP family polar landmark protein [Gammaproteobacteria bacterium]